MSPRNNHSGVGVLNTAKNEDISVPSLNLFAPEDVDSSIKEFRNQIYYPISALNSEGPFEFRLTTAQDEFLHTPFLRLGGGFRIIRQDGTHLQNVDDVSVVNLAPDSLWKSIVFEIENIKIEDTSHNYAYKAYFEKLLSQSSGAKSSHLRNDFFYADSYSAMNANDKNGGNSGYVTRSEFIKNSKILYFNSTLALDICGISKPLPPNLEYRVKLTRNSDEFTLLSTSQNFKIELVELYMEVLKLVPNENRLAQIERKFSSSSLNYPISRSKILKFSIPQGVYDASQHALFDRGQLPRFVLIALSAQNGVSGRVELNPFNFKHYNINEVCLTKNNVPVCY